MAAPVADPQSTTSSTLPRAGQELHICKNAELLDDLLPNWVSVHWLAPMAASEAEAAAARRRRRAKISCEQGHFLDCLITLHHYNFKVFGTAHQ